MQETLLNHKDSKVITCLKQQMKNMASQIKKHANEEKIMEKLININPGIIPPTLEEKNLLLPAEENTSISLRKKSTGYSPAFFAHSSQSKIKIASSEEINASIRDRLTRCNIKF
jgi:hypothetical protein